MKPTYNVRLWEIKTMPPNPKTGKKRRRPHGVRWVTEGEEHSQWFATKALAKAYLCKLQQAMNKGEAFDIVTGLPESMYREQNSRSLLQLCQRFIEREWPNVAPNTRRRLVDTLAVAVGSHVRNSDNRPSPGAKEIRRVLTTVLLVPSAIRDETPTELMHAAKWIEENSRPVNELSKKDETAALLRSLGKNLNGKPAALNTKRTRRATFFHAMGYGVEIGEITVNPLAGMKSGRGQSDSEIDPRVVVNPRQARQLLAAVSYVGRWARNGTLLRTTSYDYLVGFFAVMYYAALRPAEANRLRESECDLPPTGWGELILEESAARANARYIETGTSWEFRPLKRRQEGAVRVVPIPPQLVAILRDHLRRFGTTDDGRLFRGIEKGEPINATIYTDVWKRARVIGLAPEQAASPLARRPYDLRHAAVSTWIAAGVPITDVAARAGHTVDVLLKVYAKMLDGQRESSNSRIDDILR